MARAVPDIGGLPVYAGDSFSQTFEFLDDGEAIDLVVEGWSNWIAQYRKTPKSVDFVEFVVDDSAADEGVITISLTPQQARELGDSGVFDLQATQNGTIRTWLKGSIDWSLDVSRV
jgi:hypothetical protein